MARFPHHLICIRARLLNKRNLDSASSGYGGRTYPDVLEYSPKGCRCLRACSPSAKEEGEKKGVPLLSVPCHHLMPAHPLDLWVPTLCVTRCRQPRRHGPPGVVMLAWTMLPLLPNLALQYPWERVFFVVVCV